MNSKNLSKAINRMLAILLTAAMVAGSFTVPVKADEINDVIEQTSEPVEEVNTAVEEISEEGDEPASNDMVVKDPYPYEVEITLPTEIQTLIDNGETKYAWKAMDLKTDLLDKIVIKSKKDDTVINPTTSTASTMTQDTYTDGDSTIASANDYSIKVSKGATEYTGNQRKTIGTRIDGAGEYKLVIDIHDREGRWNDHKEYEWKITKYKLADFDKYLKIEWDTTPAQAGPKYKTGVPTAIATSDASIAFLSGSDLTDAVKAEIKENFPGITDAAITALGTNLNSTASGNAAFITMDSVATAESDLNPIPTLKPDTYLWDHAGDSLKVVKNVSADSDKPVIKFKANTSYDGTGALNDFIDETDTTVNSRYFSIIDGAIADDTVIMTANNAVALGAKTGAGSNVEYSTANSKASLAINVDVENVQTNSYSFDLADYFEDIDSGYCKLEKVTLVNSPGSFFRTGSVKITDNTVLSFDIAGNATVNSNNVILLSAKYSNLAAFNVEITVGKYTKTNNADSIKWAGKVETTEGGLKLPYKDGGYNVSEIKTTLAETAAANFGLTNGNGEQLDLSSGQMATTAPYKFQKKLSNGLWGTETTWTSTALKDLGTYRLIATYDSDKSGSNNKIAYSSEFEIVPAELKSFANSGISAGSAEYSIDSTKATYTPNILTRTSTITFGTNAEGENTGLAIGKLGTLGTDWDITYENIDAPYEWAKSTKEADTTLGTDGNICHLVSGPSTEYIYKGQPYAKIVSKNNLFDKTKPLYVTFDLKDGASSAAFAVTSNNQSVVKAAAENTKYEIELPAEMFSYMLNTSVKTAVDPADVTKLTISDSIGDGSAGTCSAIQLSPANMKPSIAKSGNGYKLTFYTNSSCGKGTTAVFTITPEFGFPYVKTGTAVDVTVKFNNEYTITLKNNRKTFKNANMKSDIIAKEFFNVKVNGSSVTPSAVTAEVYAEVTVGSSPTSTKTINGITYNLDSATSNVKDAGNYLINVTAVTTSPAAELPASGVYLPFVVDKYTLTANDITTSAKISADLRADSADFDAVKDDLSTALGDTSADEIQIITSFDGSARTHNSTDTNHAKLTKDHSSTLASRADDSYCISVAGPTSVDADTFKYDVTFKLNDGKDKNYTMAASGITKTITVKKVDVSIKANSTEATAANYSVVPSASSIGNNGKVSVGGSLDWYYDGYEKKPVVNSVSIQVGTDTGASLRTAYVKKITKNDVVTYGENINAGNGVIKIDFSNEIMYKGILTLEGAAGQAFNILARTNADGLAEATYTVQIPAVALNSAAQETVIQLPLDIYTIEAGKGIEPSVTSVTAKSYTATGSDQSVSAASGTMTGVTYGLTADGKMTVKVAATSGQATVGAISTEIPITPVFDNFDAATGKLKVKVQVVDKEIAEIKNATVEAAGKTYDGNAATFPNVRVIRKANSEDITSSVSVTKKWYDGAGNAELKEAPTDVGNYKVRVILNDNDNYIADVVDIPYEIKTAVATVSPLTTHYVYNGENQADAIVKDANGNVLEKDAKTYVISAVYKDDYDQVKDIATVGNGTDVTASGYADFGLYKLKITGGTNYTIEEEGAAANTGVIVPCYIDKKEITITPKTDIVQYKHETSPKKTYALVDGTAVTGIATIGENDLVGNDTVELAGGALKTKLQTTGISFPAAAPYEAVTGTITNNDVAFGGGGNVDNYKVNIANDGEFKISFAKQPVTVELKLYDVNGDEITKAVMNKDGKDISVDYRVTVVSPEGTVLTEGTDYTVTVPTGINQPGEYDVVLEAVEDSNYAVEGVTKTITVSKPEEIEVDAAIKVGTSAIKNDGTSQIGKSDTARQVTAAVTDKKGGAALTEGEDYTITVVKKGTTAPAEVLDLGKYTVTIESTNKTYSFETITVDFEIIETVIVVESISDVKADPSSLKPGESATVTYKVTGTENGDATDLTDKVTVNVASEKGAEGNFTYSSTSGSSPITVTAKAGAVAGDKETFTISYVEGKKTVKGTFVLRIKAESGGADPGTPAEEPSEDYEKPSEAEYKDINESGLSIIASKAYTYTGKPIQAAVKVAANPNKLVNGTDYKITYADNVSAGKGKILVSGIGQYNGLLKDGEIEFTINPKKASGFTVVAGSMSADEAKEFDEDDAYAVNDRISVYDGTTKLWIDDDYTIESIAKSSNGKKIDFVIKGAGNYDSNTQKKASIAIVDLKGKKDIAACEISDIEDKNYTGSAIKPTVTVTDEKGNPVSNANYTVTYKNNTNRGVATVTVKGKKEYAGSKVTTFNIVSPEVGPDKEVTITVNGGKPMTYTGKLLKPSVKVQVQVGGKTKTLSKNKDYAVYYGAELNAGTGRVVIRGLGNYAEILTDTEKTFTINKADFKKVSIKKNSLKQSGVYFNNKKLVVDEDFIVAVSGPDAKGKYTVTISVVPEDGSRNFTGSATKTIKGTSAQIDWEQLGYVLE